MTIETVTLVDGRGVVFESDIEQIEYLDNRSEEPSTATLWQTLLQQQQRITELESMARSVSGQLHWIMTVSDDRDDIQCASELQGDIEALLATPDLQQGEGEIE